MAHGGRATGETGGETSSVGSTKKGALVPPFGSLKNLTDLAGDEGGGPRGEMEEGHQRAVREQNVHWFPLFGYWSDLAGDGRDGGRRGEVHGGRARGRGGRDTKNSGNNKRCAGFSWRI